MKGVNVVLKGRKNDNYGYLKIGFRQSGKTKIISLGIKLKKSDFNGRTQRVRSSNKEAERINNLIEDKLSTLQLLPYQRHRINTICSYIQLVIDRTNVRGTKEKYINIKNIFSLFLVKEFNKSDILFDELNSVVVHKFYNWLLENNKKNTANYKIKSFKSFINKASSEGIFIYQLNPFISLKLSFEDTNKDYLTINELRKFINFNYKDIRKTRIKIDTKDIKDSFLFATLGQGLRVSDILTLRFNNFYNDDKEINTESDFIYLRKRMLKTKKMVFVTINKYVSYYIERQIIRVIENYLPNKLTESDYQLFISYIEEREILKREILQKNKQSFLEDIKVELETLEKNLELAEHQVYFFTIGILAQLSKNNKTKNKFVFPFLDDDKFSNIDDNNNFSMDDKQYLQFSGKRSYINLLLKNIVKQSPIDKHITFHSARHTYTTLTIENSVDIYDLQKALGHSSVLSTQEYIRGFKLEKISKLNNEITSNLFENKIEELPF